MYHIKKQNLYANVTTFVPQRAGNPNLQFLLLVFKEAEKQVEYQRLGLTPEEYYTRPFSTPISCLRISGAIVCLILLSVTLACFPSIYATKYLLQMSNQTAWDVVQEHSDLLTKVKYNLKIIKRCSKENQRLYFIY